MPEPTESWVNQPRIAGFGVCGAWRHILEDPPYGHFGDGHARYTRPRPFDHRVVIRGDGGYAIEGKTTRGAPFALPPCQDDELARFERSGAGRGRDRRVRAAVEGIALPGAVVAPVPRARGVPAAAPAEVIPVMALATVATQCLVQ